ncbi:MAG: RlmE family RNA methyltransferase [Desulfarculus sp.]|nr:RlmE family RNA methyltransferase [Pseudomonadota bacterium]MBV1716641.1 RlmE family RNA methyltransferase [Desulfarculus sp.]MBU4573745.1 RlmE family RNA methyltransferase [Pseudomonadota bacterium]MBU4597056.1 RlmE family RNA methyltransferase [Pseudomonadota bacterium]MBV1739317.1 RlmE family RNA methyltransferase [Desulfarculus sp.]
MTRPGSPDAYYRRAKSQGYAARSVFKLQEMDRRYGLLRPGQAVLDLGCHPGSWLQFASQKVGRSGRLVGVDLQEPGVSMPQGSCFIQADLLELTAAEVQERSGVEVFDLVLSDVAPHTTGIKDRDAAASLELSQAALDMALALLKPGGSFLAKVFFGPGVEDLIRQVKGAFKLGKAHKPDASRSASKEIYILGRGLKQARPG